MSTELRELFDAAAESDPPVDLAARAVAGARRRRRQRYTVAGSVLAAAAIVLGFVVVSSSERLDGAPRPDEVAGLPALLPAPGGLPRLTADTMSFASAAYVVDGQVVVLDAATGDGVKVPLSCRAGYLCGVVPGIGSDASLALSPNGRFLLVSSGRIDLEPGGVEWVWLVDVATGVATPQSFKLAPASVGSTVLQTRMAWSPSGQMFACVCSGPGRAQLLTANMSEVDADLVVSSLSGSGIAPRQISWGTDGLAAQFDELDGDWRMVPPSGAGASDLDTLAPLTPPTGLQMAQGSLVMGHGEAGGYLASFGSSLTIVTSETNLGTVGGAPPLALGPLGEGYYAQGEGSAGVVGSARAGAGKPIKVARWDLNGQSALTIVPAGTTTISFASDLVD